MALVALIACLATPVQSTDGGARFVRSGPVVGHVTAAHVAGGRLALRVGDMTALMWSVRGGGAVVQITGKRLSPRPAMTYTRRLTSAGSSAEGTVYALFAGPPAAGCWRLTLRTGTVHASFVALVRR